MTPADRDHELADYLAGELSDEDRHRFAERLEADPELRAEVEALRALAMELADSGEVADQEIEPPPLTLPVEDIPPGKHAGDRPRTLTRLRPALALVAVAAAVAIAGVVVVAGDDSTDSDTPDEATVALASFGVGPDAASGTLSSEVGQPSAVLTVDGLEPSAPGTYYEAWLISEDQKRLLPLGTFSVDEDGTADVDVELPVDPDGFRFVDISLEPDDGNPDHSGDSVLRGPSAPS